MTATSESACRAPARVPQGGNIEAMGYPDMPRIHPYQRDPHSGAGNCVCGWHEQSHRHPHIAARMGVNPQICVCRKPPEDEIHTGLGDFAWPAPLRGLEGVKRAVQRSRGGDAEHALAVIKAFNETSCCDRPEQ